MTTTIETKARPASEAQVKFINDLFAKRDLPALVLAMKPDASKISMTQASGLIDMLKGYPVKAVAPAPDKAPGQSTYDLYKDELEKVPNSKYAIRTDMLKVALVGFPLHGDMLFLEVRTYKGRKSILRLTGAPGAFSRGRIAPATAITLLRIIATDPVRCAREFGEHYKVCGRCAAELTDPVSRATQFGPECRKAFGIKA